MSKAIAHFLGEAESVADRLIADAEKICSYPSEDIRLITESLPTLSRKLEHLGLDPNDTTPEELYFSLRSKVRDTHELFNKWTGFESPTTKTSQLLEICERAADGMTVYGLKKSVAKSLLRSNPPKQTMKKLNYRSLESMLKRENIDSLFAGITSLESALWRKKFNSQLKQLSANDFEDRQLEIVKADKKYAVILKKTITPNYLFGSLCLNSVATDLKKTGLSLAIKIFETASEVRGWSAAVKMKQLSPDLGRYVALNVSTSPKYAAQFYGLPIDFHHLEAKNESILERLSNTILPLAWWKDAQHLAVRTDAKPVSLNLNDLLADEYRSAKFEDRQTDKFHEAFWRQLITRYLKYPSFRAEALKELEPELVLDEDGPAGAPSSLEVI